MGSFVKPNLRQADVALGDDVSAIGHMQTFEDRTSVFQSQGVTRHSGLSVDWNMQGQLAHSHSRAQLTIKRLLDIAGALIGLILLGPLLIITALAIKASSPGPVFFKQKREGLNGLLFDTLKFRSMRVDACDLTGVAQTQANDPRVTAVGAFIRKTSIDELPQLINVLMGDMSLVGPRPHVPNMLAGGRLYRELVPYYEGRLAMRPGITGWAQANGFRGSTRSARLARERVDHDIAYVQNFSIWLDLRIIILTVVREFVTGTGD